MSTRARVVGALVVVGLLLLAAGPLRYALGGRPVESPSAISLFGDPFAAARLDAWPTGVYDTVPGAPAAATGTQQVRKVRGAPAAEALTLAQAEATAPTTDYVAVTGPAAGKALPGVGSVVTTSDVDELMRMDEPARTDAIRYVTSISGGALGLVSMDTLPSASTRLVDSRSPERRRRLLDENQPVKEMIDVWAQQRPDLSVLVTPGSSQDPGALAGTTIGDVGLATAAYSPGASTLAAEVLDGLADGRALVAPRLFADRGDLGLFVPGDSLTPTAQGQAWTVAALAVPPGSHAAPATVTGDLEALAFERTRGGASLLVWNPGRTRTVTADLPDGSGGIDRYQVRVAGNALSAVLLRR